MRDQVSKPMHETTLRRAVREDAAAVASLLIRSRRAAVGSIPPSAHTDSEVETYVRTVVVPECEVWLAVAADGQARAVLVLDKDWVSQLYVDPSWTGRGLGSRLLDLAKERRPVGLQLWTFMTNDGAKRFYERHGFVAVETTDGHENEEKQPDIRFVWQPQP
jgi:GNAT superfamily N-acetyltransferase